MGPNFRKLLSRRAGMIMEERAGPGFDATVSHLLEGGLGPALKDAKTWCDAAMQAVRQAADPNPWKYASDEVIAEHILKKVEERNAKSEVPLLRD